MKRAEVRPERLNPPEEPPDAYLDAAQVSVLSGHVHSAVPLLVHLVQRDALLLHELEQPQQDTLLSKANKQTNKQQ